VVCTEVAPVDTTGNLLFSRRMKATVFLLVSVLLAASEGAQQAIPVPFPDSQYDKLKAEWPFTLAKPPEKQEEAKVSWAEHLYLSSVALQRTAEGGEQPWVTIRDKQEPASFVQLVLNEEKDGMLLVKVENLDDPKKTTATVKKNNELATLKRDEAQWVVSAPPPGTGAARPGGVVRPGGQVPGMPLQNGQNAIRMPGGQPAGTNTLKVPAIPKPNAIPAPNIAAPGQPGAVPAGQADPRKRIRVVPGK
jgi:hypothetical protein